MWVRLLDEDDDADAHESDHEERVKYQDRYHDNVPFPIGKGDYLSGWTPAGMLRCLEYRTQPGLILPVSWDLPISAFLYLASYGTYSPCLPSLHYWARGAPQDMWGGRPSAHRPQSTRRGETPRCSCRSPLLGRMPRSQHGRGV